MCLGGRVSCREHGVHIPLAVMQHGCGGLGQARCSSLQVEQDAA